MCWQKTERSLPLSFSSRFSHVFSTAKGTTWREHQWDLHIQVQPLTYAYNSQLHRSKNLLPFILILAGQPLSPTTFIYPMLFPTDSATNTSTHVFRALTIQRLSTMRQDVDNRTKAGQPRYNGDHIRRIRNASIKIEVGRQMHLDRPSVTTSTPECLASESNSKLLSVKMGLSRITEVSTTTVKIDEEDMRNSVSLDRNTGASWQMRRQ